MALETYDDLAAQMNADSAEFVKFMEDKGRVPTYVFGEYTGILERSLRELHIVGVYVVRAGLRYDNQPLKDICPALRYELESTNPFEQGRLHGFGLSKISIDFDNRNKTIKNGEPQEIVVRKDGQLAILTHHSHGVRNGGRDRVNTGQTHPEYYLGSRTHYDSTGVLEDTYNQWLDDLESTYNK